MRRVVIHIFGQVQKVGFRYATLQKANEFDIKGFVMNLRDGSVEIEAEGEEEKVEEFIEWCYSGPPYSAIKKVMVGEMDIKKRENEFKIF